MGPQNRIPNAMHRYHSNLAASEMYTDVKSINPTFPQCTSIDFTILGFLVAENETIDVTHRSMVSLPRHVNGRICEYTDAKIQFIYCSIRRNELFLYSRGREPF